MLKLSGDHDHVHSLGVALRAGHDGAGRLPGWPGGDRRAAGAVSGGGDERGAAARLLLKQWTDEFVLLRSCKCFVGKIDVS